MVGINLDGFQTTKSMATALIKGLTFGAWLTKGKPLGTGSQSSQQQLCGADSEKVQTLRSDSTKLYRSPMIFPKSVSKVTDF